MRCDPRAQNCPDHVILYNQTRRVEQFPETMPIQEGMPNIYGQAHLPLDPTDQNDFDTFPSIGIGVQPESQSEGPQLEVNRSPGDIIPGGSTAPAVMDIENPYRNTSHADEGMELERGPYAQSASGFSDFRMNVPAAGNLRSLSPGIGIHFLPSSQDFEEWQGPDRAEGMQPVPELVNEERTMRPQGPTNTHENQTPGSSIYLTAHQHPLQRTTSHFPAHTQRSQDVIIRHPRYMDLEARMRSYNEWPLFSRQRPESLAQAGLFYTGQRDQCCCFQCGVVLRKWEPNDDPMEEHELWNPGCPFLEEAKRNTCMTVVKAPERVAGNPAQRMQHPSAKEIKKFQVLEEMGFAREVVETAVKKVGKEADVENVLEMLLKPKMANEVELPPKMDPKVCKVCEENRVCVSQFKCGHIVCANCVPRRDGDGMFRCGICGSEVTSTAAYDNSAFHH